MATVGDVDSGLLAHRVERLHGDERDRAGVELEGPLAELVAIARDPPGRISTASRSSGGAPLSGQ